MTVDDAPVVHERQAAAVFKHGILRRLPAAFAARVGAWSAGRRVVFLDGYPGPGQYPDGSPGCPLLVAAEAHPGERAHPVTGIFVEGDREAFAVLRSVLAPFRDFDYRIFAGDLSDHLPGILSLVPDSALFALLDPAATALDHEQFTGQLLARGLAPTEVLVHLDVAGLARVGAALRAAEARHRIPGEADVLVIERLDRFLGGAWWHRDAMTVTAIDDLGRAGRVAVRIAGRFAQQVERQTGFRTITMPLRLRSGHLPTAVFVSCGRGLDGPWHAADTLGQAGLDWYEAWRSAEAGAARPSGEQVGQLSLFGVEDAQPVLSLEAYRKRHEPQWITSIERNIVRLLVDHGPFVLAERLVDVYGDTLGLAGSAQVRRAVRNLHDDGLLADDGTDDRYHLRQLRPVAAVRRPGDTHDAEQRPA
ncbi:MAG TPA: three-Cys-motif partner protein TcmP [Mycobacteriales bacterium]|nr:three-Cys-motif partner protein TcmP [Mycobacteriales bacterium]